MTENKRLKILYLVDTYYPIIGGVSTVVDKSCIALSKFADITVGTVKAKNYIDPPKPYRIIRCKGFTNKFTNDGMAFPCVDKNFRNEVESGGFDIIHCHIPLNLMNYAFKVGKKLNIPIVTTVHTILKPDIKHAVKIDWLANFITSLVMKKINKSDYVWTVTNFCKNKIKPFGITKPIKVMYNAIDFTPPENTDTLKELINEKYNINKDTFIMTFISRIVKIKNIDLIIDSISLLKKENISNFKVFLVGNGNYFNKVCKKIKKLNLENDIIMTGMVSDRNLLSAFYARSNVVLFPSFAESAGLIQVEAAAFRKPSLVVEDSAPAEKMTHLVNGIISKNTAKDYAKNILYCYNNRDELERIGNEAFKTIYRTYNNDIVTKDILDNYQFIIEDYKKENKDER